MVWLGPQWTCPRFGRWICNQSLHQSTQTYSLPKSAGARWWQASHLTPSRNDAPCLLGRPRSGDWLSDEIMDWKSAGLTDIVSQLEEHEVRDFDLTREAEIAERAGLPFERLSIPDRGVPESFEAAHTSSIRGRCCATRIAHHSL